MNFKILDCTLRDGGYYNNWNFSLNFAQKYNSIIKKTKVDIVEFGFRKNNVFSEKDKLFLYTTEKTLKKIRFGKNQLVSVMIDLADFRNKNDLYSLKKIFPEKKNSSISLIRLACNFEDKNLLKPVINILKKKNYLVAANLMKFTLLKKNLIISFFELAEKYNVDYFYLADSLGNCKPGDLINISKDLKKKFSIKKFGFHAHDNLGNALKNSLTAIKMGYGFIDTSINGMGRGAGNLKLEEVLEKQKKNVAVKIIQKFIKKSMKDFKKKYNWGTNIFYKNSAKYQIHPTFIQRLLEEKKYNNYVIKKIILFLRKLKSSSYDASIFDNLFLNNSAIKKQSHTFEKKEILIIGSSNYVNSMNAIQNYKKKYVIATLNYNLRINKKLIDYIFFCNPYRIITEINLAKDKKIIIPNIKYLYKKKNNKLIYYNINRNNFSIKKTGCSFKKNLVLFYSLAFCISNNFKKIKIININKSRINKLIIRVISQYLKKNLINIKFEYTFN